MMTRNKKQETRNKLSEVGFTLIELLVTVTIIGVLTMLGVMSYQSTNKKARDGRRQADLEQIRTSLEIYRSDSASNTYPAALADLVSGGYITTLPTDPKDSAYYYLPSAGNRSYSLCAHLEMGTTSDYCGGATNCGGTCNYRVTNP